MTTKSAPANSKNDAFAAIHSARGLRRGGVITKTTVLEYDGVYLDSVFEFNVRDIKRIREQAHVSQPVFARYLNTTLWKTGLEVLA